MKPSILQRENKPDLAYFYTPAKNSAAETDKPAVMFLGGYRSDMAGTKATYLEAQCQSRGQAYLRFDYRGHGLSGGEFEDGTIGLWLEDALAVFDEIVTKPVILVGSSMGGWIALLLARARPKQVAGVIGIAAAPDFTQSLNASFSPAQKEELKQKGFVALPNDYSDEPYIFTRALIEDGQDHCLLDRDLTYPMPIRLLQGMKDDDVPWQTAHRIRNAIKEGDVEVTLIEQGDHRLSRPEGLTLLDQKVCELSGL